jgi:hypothetical protein
MPVDFLYVEGELDEEILYQVVQTLSAAPTLERGGSKSSLAPKTRDKRKTVPNACYLRDRDFDYDPPADCSNPCVDQSDNRAENAGPQVLGFRWSRHSIENYLLEPSIVELATGWSAADFTTALVSAAHRIGDYTAARWTVGIVRRSLPPLRELATRPPFKNEIKIPDDCTSQWCSSWAATHIEDFRNSIHSVVAPAFVKTLLDENVKRIRAMNSVEQILLWHSGKDLLAALASSMNKRRPNNPVDFRRAIARWIRNNPTLALPLLPEWQALLQLLDAG